MATIVVKDDRSIALAFDATLSERHSRKNSVTRFPVERGAAVADNIRAEPMAIVVTGIVVEEPIIVDGKVLPAMADRLGVALKTLERMQSQVVDVATPIKTYKNMAIDSIDITRDAQSGQAINATVSFTEIVSASSIVIDLPEPTTRGTPTKKSNKKNAEPTTTPPKATSFLQDAAKSLAKLANADADFARIQGGG